jgi:hypothetical protein
LVEFEFNQQYRLTILSVGKYEDFWSCSIMTFLKTKQKQLKTSTKENIKEETAIVEFTKNESRKFNIDFLRRRKREMRDLEIVGKKTVFQ